MGDEIRGGDVIPEGLLARLDAMAPDAEIMDRMHRSGVLCGVRVAMEEAGYVVHSIVYGPEGGRLRLNILAARREA